MLSMSFEARMPGFVLTGLLIICGAAPSLVRAAPLAGQAMAAADPVELGRRLYLEGVLASGETITGIVAGDVKLTGRQVICGTCHRRSGMGSSEGRDVVPAVTGDLLFNSLRLPTSKPPLAPELRPAYTEASLTRAIRDGIGADGKAYSLLMPRYPLTERDMGNLLAYLKTLDTRPDPGVTDKDIHLATIVADSLDAETRKAYLDVFEQFLVQKNTETRYESHRAAKAPWHKKVAFGPYRKWVLHVWELKGAPETWPAQMEAEYRKQPVFAVLNGIAPGSWQPIHDSCERMRLPCLFPTTDLPVIDEGAFYPVYFSKGMTLEGEAVGRHLVDEDLIGQPLVQVYRAGDLAAETAARALRDSLEKRGGKVLDVRLEASSALPDRPWESVLEGQYTAPLVLWLGASDLAEFWDNLDPAAAGPRRTYLSTSLYDPLVNTVPAAVRDGTYFVHPHEVPGKLPRLLARSTGWLRAKGIYAPEHKRVQANAFFALKMGGGAIKALRGYFLRDFLMESIEHMVDNASYTSVYPRVSLGPAQRFVSKGGYIAKLSAGPQGDRLVQVTDWMVP